MEEVHTIVNLVRKYYRDERKVCIITPYDGQRAALVAALKTANLPHGNVYNVDSYQGAPLSSFLPSLSPRRGWRSDLKTFMDGTQNQNQNHNRARGPAGDRLGRAHDRAGVPQVVEPHERHAHAVSGGDGGCHQPRVPRGAREENALGEAR